MSALTARFSLRTLLAAAGLAVATLGAQAGTYSFQGQADSGPLAGTPFSGQLQFADPAAGFDGSVALGQFTLQFLGETYTLASADAAPVAWFAAGQFLGVDYLDMDAPNPSQRPWLALTAGFTMLDEFLFAYDNVGTGTQGLGGATQWTAVPSASPLALAMLGLAAAGLAGRRRSR